MSGGRHPELPEIATLVVGGGILGLCVAGFLAAEGAEVAVIDAGRIGGTTANAGSLHVQLQSRFMQLYPDLVPGLEATLHLYPKAVAFWKRFAPTLGTEIDLKITGGLMVAESREQLEFLAQKCRRERDLGLRSEILDRAAVHAFAPYLGPAIVGAELCPEEGKLNPLLANQAIRRWAIGNGARLLFEEPVARLERAGTRLHALTARGRIEAGRVVLAAGAWSRQLAAGLGVHVPAVPEPLHMNITEPAAPLIGHLVQHADRPITLKQLATGHVVIGGGWPAQMSDPDAAPAVELASIIGNATLAQHIVPQLGPLRIIRTWTGINTSVDGRAVLGESAAAPGLFFAIPGDAGYTLGPLCARLVADTILGRRPGEDIAPYSPDRF
jgi:glycine/D-amino acid oxidase-like deaminating enzyme